MPLPQEFVDLVHGDAVAPLLSARDFNAMAGVLNTATLRGPVPLEELAAFCAVKGLTGAVMALLEVPVGTDFATDVPMTLAIKGLLHTVMTVIQLDFRLTTAHVDSPEFVAGLDGLQALGVLSGPVRADLLALAEGRLSPAAAALGRSCTGEDCRIAAGVS